MTELKIETMMKTSPVIPVIVVENPASAIPLADALVRGGLRVLEVTLRTDAGLGAITAIKKAIPDAIVGAGTVRSVDEFNQAVDAGAEFIVSPGFTPSLVKVALDRSVSFLPGVNSPSEVLQLMEHGLRHMKFFPAEAAGGVPMLKSMSGPLPDVKFCPTGGISLQNAADYLSLDNVLCVGGTWMLDKAAIESQDWQTVERLAREAAQLGSES